MDEHTNVILTAPSPTLTDFNIDEESGAGVGDLVCYDDEVGSPFQGMLVSGRYRLETNIGTGAFGVVFDAIDIEENKRVAIKILSPALCDDKRALTRFRREAIAASRIQHPGIVGIEDFGIQDAGVSYIVMEFLEGRDLATLIEEEGYIAPTRAVNIVMQCAEALTAAHKAGVLHRDLKPANIFLVQDSNKSEHIRILDFGIAKDRSSNPRNADLTSASKVVGTPYYMAPEQARGLALDGRADVYSLGVILYELLVGTRPFEGGSVYEILLAHAKAPRVAPSKARPGLTFEPALDKLVLKAIHPKSSGRFDSMSAFSSSLRRYFEHAGRPSSPYVLPSRADPAPPLSSRLGSGDVTRQRPATRNRLSKRLLWAAIPAAAIALLFALPGSPDTAARAAKDSPQPSAVPVSAEQEATLPAPTKIVSPRPAKAIPIPKTSAENPSTRSSAPVPQVPAPARMVAPATTTSKGKSASESQTSAAERSSKPRKLRKPRNRPRRNNKPKGIEEW